MLMRRISISLAVVFVCLALAVPVNAEPNFANVYTGNIKKRPLEFVPGRVLVKFKKAVTDDEADGIVRGLGAHIKRRGPRRAFNVVSVPVGQVWRKIQALSRNPRVEYAHPDWIVYAADFPYDPPNDPRYGPYQWNLHSSAEGGINMEPAWAINMGGSQEVVLAVLDTGIAYEDNPASNPTYCRSRDFDGTSFAPGYDFINNDSHPNDDNGHGTHVASTIAETTNNGKDFAGIAPRTTLMPVKILGSDGSGAISTIADGIYFAVDHGADIISMSFGTSAPRFFLTALENAVTYAHSNGVLLVAASGNAGADNPMYPAGYNEVIAVGATTNSGGLASYSNRGNEICAPGGDYYNPVYQYDFTFDSNWYCVFSIQGAYGTSMATPHVSGVAALVLAEDPSLTNEEIRQILRDTADDIGVSACGSGFLNAYAALQSVATEDTPPAVEITSPADGSTVSGEVIITANASDDNGVTQVEFIAEDSSTGEDSSIGTDSDGSDGWSVTWDTTTFVNGSYMIKATATDTVGQTGSTDSNTSVTVTVNNTTEETPPTVEITSPANGSTVSGEVIITANASDDNGVTQVEFIAEDSSTGEDSSIGTDSDGSDGWSVTWDTTTFVNGSYMIKATATDTVGQTGSTDSNTSVTVTVNNTTEETPPTVEITSPANGSTVSGDVTIRADASDDNGVTQVEFFAEGTSLGVDLDGSNGWSAVWHTTADDNGSHVITARATDTGGYIGEDSIRVTVNIPTEDTAPTVEITAPGDLSTVSGDVTIRADASDDVGVDYVTFFVDDMPIGVDGNSSEDWSVAWDTTTVINGLHAVKAIVTDTKGHTGEDSITVTVSNKHIHIGDLDGFSTRLKWDVVWQATVTITVRDHLHNPVQGANVAVLWSDGSPDQCLLPTDANGRCTAIGFQWRWNQWLGLTVTNVNSTLPYEPIDNDDPDGDSDGTEIWIRR